jgi:precorrin-2/cobalt-factor-2 C20-methyltransferase
LPPEGNIAFLTLGDPSIYSTYIYLHRQVLEAGFEARLIPGVPSFCAVAARLNDCLCIGSEPLQIIPASHQGLAGYLEGPGTKILMKSGESFPAVRAALAGKGLLARAAMVERCGMEGEKVYRDLNEVQGKPSYFTIIVVKDKESEQ